MTQEQRAALYDLYPTDVRLIYKGNESMDLLYKGMNRPNSRRLRDSKTREGDWVMLLRPLSSVSESEWKQVALASGYSKARCHDWKMFILRGYRVIQPLWQHVNAAIKALRALGVDMDNMIAQGLAVDVNSVESQKQ